MPVGIIEHHGAAVAHGGDQGVGGAEVYTNRQPLLMRQGGCVGFCNLEKRHKSLIKFCQGIINVMMQFI